MAPRVVAIRGRHPVLEPAFHLHTGGTRAYSQSKLAQIMAGFELAERVASEQITVNSLHPATYMPTKIVLEGAAARSTRSTRASTPPCGSPRHPTSKA